MRRRWLVDVNAPMRLVIRYATVIMFDSPEFRTDQNRFTARASSRLIHKIRLRFLNSFVLFFLVDEIFSVNVHSFCLSHSANHNCILIGTTVHRLLPSTNTDTHEHKHTHRSHNVFSPPHREERTKKMASECFLAFVLVHSNRTSEKHKIIVKCHKSSLERTRARRSRRRRKYKLQNAHERNEHREINRNTSEEDKKRRRNWRQPNKSTEWNESTHTRFEFKRQRRHAATSLRCFGCTEVSMLIWFSVRQLSVRTRH